ncbi:hypothetical protein Chor_015246 [Crotalus horridus]
MFFSDSSNSYKSGNIYEGQWERDLRHGEGRMRWLTSNQEYTGNWVNGIQYPLRNEYVGDFVNGDRHGHGKFFFASGAMYDGEWVLNKKHGKGKLVFKNGRVYEGEFNYDHIAECPSLQVDMTNMEELSNLPLKGFSGIDSVKVVDHSRSSCSSGPNIEIDLSTLLAIFPEKDREDEMKQTEYAVLRYISELRRIYTFYSSLGYDHSLDNTFLMTKLQFWRFLKDCRFHYCNQTLASMDRILNDCHSWTEFILVGSGNDAFSEVTPEIRNQPDLTFALSPYATQMLKCIMVVSSNRSDTTPRLFKCFSKLMVKNICPNACCIKGILFSDRQQAVYALSYIDKCWEIFQAFCRPSTLPPYEPTMTMRHFLWMLKLVFLEFFEALVDCALLYVTDEMLKQQAEEVAQEVTASYRPDALPERSETASLPPELSSPLQSVHTRSTSSDEASTEGTDVTTTQVGPKYSSSKIVHFVEVGKTKKSEGHKKGSITVNVVFSPIPEEKEATIEPLPVLGDLDKIPLKELAGGTSLKGSVDQSIHSVRCLRLIHFSSIFPEKLEKEKNEEKDKLNLWMSQMYIFFVKKFFANYKNLQLVNETIEDNRAQEAELSILRKKQEEEEEAK